MFTWVKDFCVKNYILHKTKINPGFK